MVVGSNPTQYIPILLGKFFEKRLVELDDISFAIFGRFDFIYIYVYTHTHIYIYMYTHTHTHTHTHTYIYIYIIKSSKNQKSNHGKIYYGTSDGTFKQRYGNHKKSFKHEKK